MSFFNVCPFKIAETWPGLMVDFQKEETAKTKACGHKIIKYTQERWGF